MLVVFPLTRSRPKGNESRTSYASFGRVKDIVVLIMLTVTSHKRVTVSYGFSHYPILNTITREYRVLGQWVIMRKQSLTPSPFRGKPERRLRREWVEGGFGTFASLLGKVRRD